uniref:Uncharacterized protein n=1 Tax=Romanomermis culicivorax TaxID=13658 RepID=A0A915J4M4_ROMCU
MMVTTSAPIKPPAVADLTVLAASVNDSLKFKLNDISSLAPVHVDEWLPVQLMDMETQVNTTTSDHTLTDIPEVNTADNVIAMVVAPPTCSGSFDLFSHARGVALSPDDCHCCRSQLKLVITAHLILGAVPPAHTNLQFEPPLPSKATTLPNYVRFGTTDLPQSITLAMPHYPPCIDPNVESFSPQELSVVDAVQTAHYALFLYEASGLDNLSCLIHAYNTAIGLINSWIAYPQYKPFPQPPESTNIHHIFLQYHSETDHPVPLYAIRISQHAGTFSHCELCHQWDCHPIAQPWFTAHFSAQNQLAVADSTQTYMSLSCRWGDADCHGGTHYPLQSTRYDGHYDNRCNPPRHHND